MRAQRLALATMAAVLAVHGGAAAAAQEQAAVEYRVVATSKTSTLERELNEAADAGFRVEALMGGETAFGGHEVVVVLARRPDAGGHEYRVLATNRTSTMRSEIRRAGEAGYAYIGQTVFRSAFGGDEVVVVLGRDGAEEPRPREYEVLATSRTSTMQRELQEAGANGLTLVGMTVGQTAFGAWEIVAILQRDAHGEEP